MSAERIEAVYDREHGQLFISHITIFEETNIKVLNPFAEDLLQQDKVCEKLEKMGHKTFQEKLRQYIICRYGGNDDKADIDLENNISTSDYCHCGQRGACTGEGFEGLCSVSAVDSKKLSKSELRVLELTANGLTASDIAKKLFKSDHTIRTQQKDIQRKLEVHNMATAIAKASKSGII